MKKTSFFSFIALILGVVFIGYIAQSSYKESKRNKQIQNEIAILQEEADKIRRDNFDLQDKISYFETDDFQERIAKEKLNLQKAEESVVIIKPSLSAKNLSAENDQQPGVVMINDNASNYSKWWDYFFKYE